jgi:hypothetical protein
MSHKIITIARQFGSGGHEVAQRLSDQLGIPLYDRNLVVKAFMNDPLVKHKCRDEGEIRKLADDMIHNTERYLPAGWK